MILSCPSCEVQYFADEATIGESGRTVKCASCGHSWHVAPPSVEPPKGAHETYRLRRSQRLRKRSRAAAVTAWAATATAFFVMGAGAVVLRDDVARYWPESAAAYKAAGLDVNRFGLEFGVTEAQRTFDGTTPILTVSGEAVSVSRVDRASPSVRIGLRDETGREVADVLTSIEPGVIPAGEAGRFSAVIESPPIEAFEIELSFVAEGGSRSQAEGGGRVEAAPEETAALAADEARPTEEPSE
ncbi:MAG: MJ0042-type zinc finger domain-containing protein [Pseudomonadota bacterium]